MPTPAAEEIPDRYVDERTPHTYDVIEMWKLDPRVLLKYEGLLPLATLCRTESGEKLLTEVAARVNRIKSRVRRREILNEARVFAGLRYDKGLVNRILKESDMLEESVIYQDIMQRGEPRGALKLLLRQLERRFGKLPSQTRRQIERLPVTQIEELGMALLDFTDKGDLRTWLKQNAAAR